MTDQELMKAFADGSLTADAFGHRQHVRLAWLHVTRLPLLEAIRRQTTGLRRLTERFGAPSRYHETITVAYVLLVHERAWRSRCASFEEFIEANPDLLDRGADLLGRHYDRDVLRTPAARGSFVPPNRPSCS